MRKEPCNFRRTCNPWFHLAIERLKRHYKKMHLHTAWTKERRQQLGISLWPKSLGLVSKPNLQKSKKIFRFWTFNVLPLNSQTKIGELIHLSRRSMIDVTCLQKHKMFHLDYLIKYHYYENGSYLLICNYIFSFQGFKQHNVRQCGDFFEPWCFQFFAE